MMGPLYVNGFNNEFTAFTFFKTLNPLLPNVPFDPPENIRKPKVFRCFQEDQKGTLGSKGLR